MRMEGKVAIISGGARGLGAAQAILLARESACVTIGDVLVEEGKKLADQIVDSGGQAMFQKLDVTKEADWRQIVQATVQKYGKLNVLVNNAGISVRETVEETTEEVWDRAMDVNAKGVLFGSKWAIPEMRKAGGGSIVNISSDAGIVGNSYGAAYGASKGAVRILTKDTAIQYAKDNIRANSIHPGPIDTPMLAEALRSLPPDVSAQSNSPDMMPLGRIGEPNDIAYGVLYLASDESTYVTGAELSIDGGRVAS
jgi:cyclopentanol dehydrogenase